MRNYILKRILKSIISIFVVVAIVVAMVYTMIDRTRIFQQDTQYNKLSGAQRVAYTYSTLENLGYLDYKTIGEMCSLSEQDTNECQESDSEAQKNVVKEFQDKGYDVRKTGNTLFATRDYTVFEIVGRYFSNMFQIDHPGKIKDPNNEGLDESRGYYFGTDHNGIPALMGSGTEYKYQIYFDGKFPFIHSNILKLSFGNSYPANKGIPTVKVISDSQGSLKTKEVVYPSGLKAKTAENLHSARYKYSLDHLDQKKFVDNYANVELNKSDPSMIGTSYIFGIASLILAYAIALPAGVAMARNKGKLVDKIGIVYINLLIALPSLAFIYIVKYLGSLAKLPDKFSQSGFANPKSYILPIIVLTVLSTTGIMTWIRRYMIDQSTADYVKFARAKGLSRKEISQRHILKNAIIPIVNGIPGSIVLAIGGSIITEAVFAIPGMGKMLPDSIKGSNNNMIITLTFIFTTLSIFSLLAGDILLTIVDPRISLNAKKGDI